MIYLYIYQMHEILVTHEEAIHQYNISLKPKQHFHFFLITVKGPKWMDPWIH